MFKDLQGKKSNQVAVSNGSKSSKANASSEKSSLANRAPQKKNKESAKIPFEEPFFIVLPSRRLRLIDENSGLV
ncbi:MAG: hypothetical protein JWQ35_951 [Bacteriovoracaceae bacterium]|nr:hypothetical protein [Bacteriovoracaceae bacterium]